MAKSDDNKTVESATKSNTDREGCCDVFLSFHDSDTGYAFSDYLYGALCDENISTFRMHEKRRGPEPDNLETEDEISKAKAIEECLVAVVVLSEHYAKSKWCLRDLAKIAARRNKDIKDIIVIPIFYHVKIDNVKGINDDKWCYKKFFDAHEEDVDVTKSDLKEWKDAFAIFTGNDQSSALKQTEKEGPFHSETVKEALQSISRCVEAARRKADVSGTKSKKYKELKRLISKTETQDVRIIIVVGPSGSGKTNIVGHTYNKQKAKFESYHCFLKDIGCNSQNDVGTMRLQQQIVSDIRNRGKPNFKDIHQGSESVVDVIGVKVFIVLDNVNSKSEIERLVEGGMDTLKTKCKPGSLFIITTTNKDILSGSELIIQTCKVDPLTEAEARILFCQHAFKTNNPEEDFDSLTNDIVSLAGGLPLTLVILGSLIFNEKNKNLWGALFNKIKDVPCREAHDRLRIGYDALDYTQRQIFLDIACFFDNVRKEYPMYMWEDCDFHPEDGIKTLESRSLITIGGDDNIIRMNEQLIKLGRQIVKEKASEPYYKVHSKRSRLWDQHEALETLTKCRGAEKVKALNLNMQLLASGELEKLQLTKEEYLQKTKSVATVAEEEKQQNQYIRRLQGEYFSNLRSLIFLQLGYVSLYGKLQHLFFNLKWLQWTCCEESEPQTIKDKVTPITFFPENLVILDLSNSTITDKWEHWESFKVAKKLKVLNLSGCKFIKECYTFFRFLEILDLSRTPLKQINLWPLKNLKALDLSCCGKIENLDCSKQTQLETLNLLSCTSLAKVTGLEKSKLSLKYFNVGECSSLEELPDFSGYEHETFLRSSMPQASSNPGTENSCFCVA